MKRQSRDKLLVIFLFVSAIVVFTFAQNDYASPPHQLPSTNTGMNEEVTAPQVLPKPHPTTTAGEAAGE